MSQPSNGISRLQQALRRTWISTCVVICAVGVCVAPAAGDQLERYLERQGLRSLLAVHLEQQLAEADRDLRQPIVLRLADLYAELLGEATTDAVRAELEAKGVALLEEVPSREADQLRMAILRGGYRTAERIAEQHRLRLADDESVAWATTKLTEIVPKFDELLRTLKDNEEALKRQLRRTSGRSADTLVRLIDRNANGQREAQFLNAWSSYYLGWLTRDKGLANKAQGLFAELIDPEQPAIQPEQVSRDLRSLEPIARSILGMALAKALTAQPATAVAWIELLEVENAFEPLRREVPIWKDAILLDSGDFTSVRRRMEQYDTNLEEPPLAWLRLVTVYALEMRQPTRASIDVLQRAVTELANRGELAQVFDLAKRYGTDALGTSGFALQYVRGVLDYHEARESHGDDSPSTVPLVQGQYTLARDKLESALRESDVDAYRAAAAGCARLIGWCWYFVGDFAEAVDAFTAAADHDGASEASESLWMAIVSLDLLLRDGTHPDDTALRARLDALAERFLAEYPASEHAPRLVLKRATNATESTPELVAGLLAIPPSSDVYASARQRAAIMLYKMFRQADDDLRAEWGNEYISVALPLLTLGETDMAASSDLDRARFVGHCRRLLEVALDPKLERLVAARTALDLLDGLHETAPDQVEPFRDEIDFRAVQLHLYRGEAGEAMVLADRIWLDADEIIWSRLATRAMFREARTAWAGAGGRSERGAAARVVKYGQRVLEEYSDRPDAMQETNIVLWYKAVAEAASEIYERVRDEEQGRLALEIFRDRLLKSRPDNAEFLRATGRLASSFNEHELALQCWRRLSSGSPTSSDAWFEARVYVLRSLEQTDPERARAVLTQHVQLNPDYGPAPWGEQLRELDRRLRSSSEREASEE